MPFVGRLLEVVIKHKNDNGMVMKSCFRTHDHCLLSAIVCSLISAKILLISIACVQPLSDNSDAEIKMQFVVCENRVNAHLGFD